MKAIEKYIRNADCLKMTDIGKQHWHRHLARVFQSNWEITTCAPSNSESLWDKFKKHLSEDFLRDTQGVNLIFHMEYTPKMFNQALILLEDKCVSINGKDLLQVELAAPHRNGWNLRDGDIRRGKNYNINALQIFVKNNRPLLITDQRQA